MMKNNKGITIVELLISISVGSILIITLMSILTTTLITRNVIDYTNRLDDEIFDINDFLGSRFNRMGYKSILEVDVTPEGQPKTQSVFLLTTEFSPSLVDQDGTSVIVLDRSVFVVMILLLDTERDAIYFDELFKVETPDPILGIASYEDQIDLFLSSLNAYVSSFLSNPTNPISSPNLIFHEGSEIVFQQSGGSDFCVKSFQTERLENVFDIDNLVSSCSNAFLNFNLVVSYQLPSGGVLAPKIYNSTIYY